MAKLMLAAAQAAKAGISSFLKEKAIPVTIFGRKRMAKTVTTHSGLSPKPPNLAETPSSLHSVAAWAFATHPLEQASGFLGKPQDFLDQCPVAPQDQLFAWSPVD